MTRSTLVLCLLAVLTATVIGGLPAASGASSPSARGPLILYGSSWAGPSEIFAVDPAGRAPTAQLTFDAPTSCTGASACGASDPLPSPDGRQFLYHSSHGVPGFARPADSLWLARADGSGARLFAPVAGPPLVWTHDGLQGRLPGDQGLRSPDGRWRATTSTPVGYPSRIVVERLAGARPPIVLTAAEVPYGADARWPAWSPDSRFLAYVASDGIRLLDPRTRKTRLLSHDTAFEVAWSPDGTQLAYLQGNGDGENVGDLRTVSLSGHVRVIVAANGPYGGPMFSFAWTNRATGVRYRVPPPVGGLYTGWRVTQLAADGDQVAYATCGGVFAWRPGSTEAQKVGPPVLGDGCGEAFFHGEFSSLAVAGDRLAYATLYGGNTSNWALGGASLGPTTQSFELLSGTNTCCLPDPEVAGSGNLLVFASRAEVRGSYPDVLWEIRSVGATGCPCPELTSFQQSLHAEMHIDDVDAGRIVVDRPDFLRVLDSSGTTLLALDVHSTEAALSGGDLVVHVAGELRDYDAGTGALLHTWQPAGLAPALQDAAQGLVAYVVDAQVHLLRLRDGADAIVGHGSLARFMNAGLVYADGARIHLVPFAELPLR